MLRRLRQLTGLRIMAADGELGRADDFYFDDSTWAIRYLVVDIGRHQPGREVLIAPASVGLPDWDQRVLPVTLTVEQVRNSPQASSDLPVSRQHEIRLASYYNWAPYWTVPGPDGAPSAALAVIPPQVEHIQHPGDPHLRSVNEVTNYGIMASDGEIGHVEDFVASVGEWIIRYMVANTRKWLPGRKVLVAPQWLARVDWEGKLVHAALTREQVKHSQQFNPASLAELENEPSE